ncbi:MAG TPA: thioredoxin domain-containing protein [Gemmatimonadales bacterium]|nr:thioredoxin domain-containing protein [Gemmatimonadales bacterium]
MTASRLAAAQSPYLRSAAHQPIEWFPWGPEPFERARAEGKPVLLDIGAAWCHWCHVMDAESYENPRVAEVLNRDWICIKVDRDERPDVDARYQRAVQTLTGQGGWPLTAFLTPDGDVFYGGTYFPPEDAHGRPGFLSVLTELRRFFSNQPVDVARQSAEIKKHMSAAALDEGRRGRVTPRLLADAADRMARVFDVRYGGFGTQPKFPHPGACEFLLARWYDTGERWPAEIAHRTLCAMATGGIHDQVGGGFHRYSVDARWIVPHFEKMTCDNAELLRAYTHGALTLSVAGARAGTAAAPPRAAELYGLAAGGIADWVMEALAHPEGGYGASQDADVGPGDDGDYFTWTTEEVRAVTTDDEFAVLSRHYDIDEFGEMPHNRRRNVLWVRRPVAEIAAATGKSEAEVDQLLRSGRARLKAARDRRPAPAIDPTLYVGWNAMMASALLGAAALLQRPPLERHALKTLERLFVAAAGGDGARGVGHAVGGSEIRLLEDQVQLAAAAIDAFEVTGDRRWLERARAIAEFTWSEFRAPEGGLYDTPAGEARGASEGFLKERLRPIHDAPSPSGNGVAAIVFARLAEHVGESPWRERLVDLLESFAGSLEQASLHAATALRAADWSLQPAAHLVIVGTPDDAGAQRLLLAARIAYHPRKVITRLVPGAVDLAPPALRAMLDGRAPRAYVCVGTRCGPPVDHAEDVAAALTELAAT